MTVPLLKVNPILILRRSRPDHHHSIDSLAIQLSGSQIESAQFEKTNRSVHSIVVSSSFQAPSAPVPITVLPFLLFWCCETFGSLASFPCKFAIKIAQFTRRRAQVACLCGKVSTLSDKHNTISVIHTRPHPEIQEHESKWRSKREKNKDKALGITERKKERKKEKEKGGKQSSRNCTHAASKRGGARETNITSTNALMLHHHTSADKARYSTACGTNLDDTADQTTMDSSQDTRQQKQEQQPHKPTSQQPRADKSKSKSSNNSGSSQQLQSPTKSHSSSQADSSRHIISAKPSTSTEMPQYTSRDMGDPSQIRRNKQSMADLKLRRLTELNSRLKEDLERERIPVSQASKRYEESVLTGVNESTIRRVNAIDRAQLEPM